MDKSFFDEEVESALAVLRRGGVILYPTDTIWGIGCEATSEEAVKRIYRIKQRADSKSMIILVSDEREVLQYVAAPDPRIFDFLEEQERPTTVVFEGAIGLPDVLLAEDGSIGIRIVRDEFCRHLVRRLRKPLVSTSANISGRPAPQNFSGVEAAILSGVDHIVKWRQKETAPAQASQVIRWKNGNVEYIRK